MQPTVYDSKRYKHSHLRAFSLILYARLSSGISAILDLGSRLSTAAYSRNFVVAYTTRCLKRIENAGFAHELAPSAKN